MCEASTPVVEEERKCNPLEFHPFQLQDQKLFKTYIDRFKPRSCEYNFSNLFSWQYIYQMSWTLYRERLLIVDTESQYAIMPLGDVLDPKELAVLSAKLECTGLVPDIGLVSSAYLETYPDFKKYYRAEADRDGADYIYRVENLSDLTGTKLHKKRNLISQFKRINPDFEVHPLEGALRQEALKLSRDNVSMAKEPSHSLEQELSAIEVAFDYFDSLGLEGLAVTADGGLVAFSVYSPLNFNTYNIHFEKSKMGFKGAAQMINQETARLLRNRCEYLNREQDLGVKGLRQAKMSYEPSELLIPYRLIYTPTP